MNTVAAVNHDTTADYLAAEAIAPFKSGYYAGEVFPLAGGTLNLKPHLRTR